MREREREERRMKGRGSRRGVLAGSAALLVAAGGFAGV